MQCRFLPLYLQKIFTVSKFHFSSVKCLLISRVILQATFTFSPACLYVYAHFYVSIALNKQGTIETIFSHNCCKHNHSEGRFFSVPAEMRGKCHWLSWLLLENKISSRYFNLQSNLSLVTWMSSQNSKFHPKLKFLSSSSTGLSGPKVEKRAGSDWRHDSVGSPLPSSPAPWQGKRKGGETRGWEEAFLTGINLW